MRKKEEQEQEEQNEEETTTTTTTTTRGGSDIPCNTTKNQKEHLKQSRSVEQSQMSMYEWNSQFLAL